MAGMTQVREELSRQELAMVISHYDIGRLSEASPLPRGAHAAAKMLLTTDRGRFLLKRRPRGKDDPYRVAFAHALQSYLASKNFPLPHLIGTREQNNSMLKIEDAIYEMFEFVEGGPYDGSVEATGESGRTLALYHRLLRDYHPQWEPPRGHYHDAKTVKEAFPNVGKTLLRIGSARGQKEALVDLLSRLRRTYVHAAEAVNELGMAQWEAQIVHSDWHPGNLIFRGRYVVAVIDYDAARVQPRVTDIANGCLQFSTVTGGRDLSTWEDHTDIQRAKAFLAGYDDLEIITQAELAAIPYLMQEALIAQALPPILRTGTFAGLDGFEFLKIVRRKVDWLQKNLEAFQLEDQDAGAQA